MWEEYNYQLTFPFSCLVHHWKIIITKISNHSPEFFNENHITMFQNLKISILFQFSSFTGTDFSNYLLFSRKHLKCTHDGTL